MEDFACHRLPPLIVLTVEANMPLVQAAGGKDVTESFFDNDRRVCLASGQRTPYYDFINGEPYSRWE